jgi:hypothetical protein
VINDEGDIIVPVALIDLAAGGSLVDLETGQS